MIVKINNTYFKYDANFNQVAASDEEITAAILADQVTSLDVFFELWAGDTIAKGTFKASDYKTLIKPSLTAPE